MLDKTWLGKIIADLLEVFKTNWPKFVASLWPKVPKELQEKVSLVIQIVENVKAWVNSPTADFLVSVIPGDLDDDLLKFFRKWFNSSEYAVVVGLEEFKSLSNEHAHLLATCLTKDLTGLSFGQSAITTEVAYQAFKKEQSA